MNLLKKTKTYLIGPMQYAHDGTSWREYVQNQLEPLGIICFNPYDKPFLKDVAETKAVQENLKREMLAGNFRHVEEEMKVVRYHDLNLCDRSDFLTAHIVPTIATWGAVEELVVSTRMKKPIFLSIEGGKKQCPLWLMGMIPSKYIYGSIQESVAMIKKIDAGEVEIDSDRWRLLREEYR